MGLWSQLFRPGAVKDVLFALDALDETTLSRNLAYADIKDRARKLIIVNPKLVKYARIADNKTPLELAITSLVTLCGNDLKSGHYHVYRGILSQYGRLKKALFMELQDLLLEKGLIEDEDHAYAETVIEAQIREAG